MNLFPHTFPQYPWNTSSIPADIGDCREKKSSIQNCKALQSKEFFCKTRWKKRGKADAYRAFSAKYCGKRSPLERINPYVVSPFSGRFFQLVKEVTKEMVSLRGALATWQSASPETNSFYAFPSISEHLGERIATPVCGLTSQWRCFLYGVLYKAPLFQGSCQRGWLRGLEDVLSCGIDVETPPPLK